MLLLNAEDFGLPQRRKRLFIIAVHRQRADDELICGAEAVLESVVGKYLPATRLERPSVVSWWTINIKHKLSHKRKPCP